MKEKINTNMFYAPMNNHLINANANKILNQQILDMESRKKSIKEYNENRIKTFANLSNKIVNDINVSTTSNESVIYRKYEKDVVLTYLENPQTNAKSIRELSAYLYQTSPHYKRLIEYYANLMLLNYVIVPLDTPVDQNGIDKFREEYVEIARECAKYNIKQECTKALKICLRDGIFCGLEYETEDSYYILPFNANYSTITKLEDGCFKFSIDLSYFNNNAISLPQYGSEIENAYNSWKNDSKNNPRYFEPSNGICLKSDESDIFHSIPTFTGLLLSVYDIEDYKMLQKAKTENDNYAVLALKLDLDDNGIPLIDGALAEEYYYQAAENIADNVGLIMTPFDVTKYSFQGNSSGDRNSVTDAESEFWSASGTSPLIFGSTKATSSSSLSLSIKPDEEISMGMIRQFERFINKKIKLKNYTYKFKIEFLSQSIFNSKELIDNLKTGATYGVSGAKLKYASALGINPNDVLGLSYLENDILGIGTEMFNRPLISSNTLSNGVVGEDGRPTVEESGGTITDAGEATREQQ